MSAHGDVADDKRDDPVPLTKPRCYYFQTTGCTKPDCFFMHDRLVAARPPVCSHWEQGDCRFEQSCIYFHNDGHNQDVRGSLDHIPKLGQAKPHGAAKPRPKDRRPWRKDVTTTVDAEGWVTTTRAKKPPRFAPVANDDAWDEAPPSRAFAALNVKDQ